MSDLKLTNNNGKTAVEFEMGWIRPLMWSTLIKEDIKLGGTTKFWKPCCVSVGRFLSYVSWFSDHCSQCVYFSTGYISQLLFAAKWYKRALSFRYCRKRQDCGEEGREATIGISHRKYEINLIKPGNRWSLYFLNGISLEHIHFTWLYCKSNTLNFGTNWSCDFQINGIF